MLMAALSFLQTDLVEGESKFWQEEQNLPYEVATLHSQILILVNQHNSNESVLPTSNKVMFLLSVIPRYGIGPMKARFAARLESAERTFSFSSLRLMILPEQRMEATSVNCGMTVL